ncbi:hypothetical protein MBLNU230_g1508t1 [Neophaeotheca triangularis]
MTRLGGKTLSEHWSTKNDDLYRLSFFPMAPDRIQLDHGPEGSYQPLTLEGGLVMAKPGYVRMDQGFKMPWTLAEKYAGNRSREARDRVWQLDAASLARLLYWSSSWTIYFPRSYAWPEEQYLTAEKREDNGALVVRSERVAPDEQAASADSTEQQSNETPALIAP